MLQKRKQATKAVAGEFSRKLGASIRARRAEHAMSPEQLAERAKVSVTFLLQYEGGTRSPTVEAFYRICEALGVKPVDFLKGIGH